MSHIEKRGLVDELLRRQGTTPDEQFALPLAMARSTWRMVRVGQRRLGVVNLARVLEKYPDLTNAVLDYIRDRNSE